jgi:hypothetical protein
MHTNLRLMLLLSVFLRCALPWCSAVHAQTAVEQVNLNHQLPQLIAERLKPLLAEGEYVVPARNEVLIGAAPGKIAQYRELIAKWDVAQRQWLLEVRQGESAALAQAEVAAQGSVAMSNRGASGILTISGSNSTSANARTLTQSVRVLDGAQVRVTLGHSIPLTLLAVQRLPDGGAFVRTTAVQLEAQSGIHATVRAMPQDDLAEVELAPRLAQINPAGRVSQASSSSIVQIKTGDWVTVAESAEQSSRSGTQQDTQQAGRYLVQIRLTAVN